MFEDDDDDFNIEITSSEEESSDDEDLVEPETPPAPVAVRAAAPAKPVGGAPCAAAGPCASIVELTAAIVSAQLSGLDSELLKLEVWDESFSEWVSPDGIDDIDEDSAVRLQLLEGGDADSDASGDPQSCSVLVHVDAAVAALHAEAAASVEAAVAELAEAAALAAEEEAQALAKEEAEIAAEGAHAAAEAANVREITLMLLPNALLPSNRKLKVSVTDLEQLVTEVREKFDLPADIFLSNAVTDGDEHDELTSLDEVGSKAKVQVWSPAAEAAAAAAAAQAGALATEEAQIAAQEEAMAAEKAKTAAAGAANADSEAAAAAHMAEAAELEAEAAALEAEAAAPDEQRAAAPPDEEDEEEAPCEGVPPDPAVSSHAICRCL